MIVEELDFCINDPFSLSSTIIQCLWVVYSPAAQNALGYPAVLEHYANEFVKYYTNYGASDFTTQVWVNNSFIAVQMIALGITGIGTLSFIYKCCWYWN